SQQRTRKGSLMMSSIEDHSRGVMPSGAQWQCGSAVWRRWAKSFRHEGHTPTPGSFSQRVRNRLKRKELSFEGMQKSAQECEKKGDSSETPWNIRGSERLTSDVFRTPGSFRKSGKCRTYGIRNLEECTESGRQDRQRTERARME